MSTVVQFPRSNAAPTQILKVTFPGTRIDAEATLSQTAEGWESHVFCCGHWEAGGICDTRDDALKAALSSICALLYRETSAAA